MLLRVVRKIAKEKDKCEKQAIDNEFAIELDKDELKLFKQKLLPFRILIRKNMKSIRSCRRRRSRFVISISILMMQSVVHSQEERRSRYDEFV